MCVQGYSGAISMGFEVPMGWLRLVDSLKIYVSFAKYPLKRDHILQRDLYFKGAY